MKVTLLEMMWFTLLPVTFGVAARILYGPGGLFVGVVIGAGLAVGAFAAYHYLARR